MTIEIAMDQQQQEHAAAPEAEELRVRGLLHDLGHQMMTLSLLAESVRDDNALSTHSRQRMDLVMQEMFRIVDIISDSAAPSGLNSLDPPGPVDVRQLANDVANLADVASDASVTVRPGPAAIVTAGSTLLWRVLANLVDNAVRATGPGGRVELTISQAQDTVVEVADDGPGFGPGGGAAGLGLIVVGQLLDAVHGRLEFADRPGTGARVLVYLPR